jgi:hypothetical protein
MTKTKTKVKTKAKAKPKINPFKLINEISKGKDVVKADPTRLDEYLPWFVNKAFSYYIDTQVYANLLNQFGFLDKKMQYDFFINIIRPRARDYVKWAKKEENEKLELVKEFFDYGDVKAHQVLSILTDDDFKTIKTKLEKGG